MSKTAKIIEQIRRTPQNIRFDDLVKVCAHYFGEPARRAPHTRSTKHRGKEIDPRVNIQRGKDGNAKAYQVRQVLDAVARLGTGKNEEGNDDA